MPTLLSRCHASGSNDLLGAGTVSGNGLGTTHAVPCSSQVVGSGRSSLSPNVPRHCLFGSSQSSLLSSFVSVKRQPVESDYRHEQLQVQTVGVVRTLPKVWCRTHLATAHAASPNHFAESAMQSTVTRHRNEAWSSERPIWESQ